MIEKCESENKMKGSLLGARHLQVFLIFLAIVVNFILKTSVSVALVAMTDAETANPDFQEFDWNEKQKSYILSSFFWGYFLTQFPGGYLAQKVGVKTCILTATLGSSFFSMLVPICVPWGQWQVFCVIRIIQGLFQGIIFPTITAHLSKWSPADERSRLGALAYLGIPIGVILAMEVTGLIAASNWGWPGITYVYAGTGVAFCIIWMIFAKNSPSDDRLMSSIERIYILSSQASEAGETKGNVRIPWKAILTSVPFYSLLVVSLSQAWSGTIMETQIPAYLHGVLKMDIKSSALYSMLPHLAMLVMSVVFLIGSGVVLTKQWASLATVEKAINTIAMWGPAALLIGVGFLNENQKGLAVMFLTLNSGLNGGYIIGHGLNTIDISPNYAGILMGIINCMANFIAIVTTLAVGMIVYDETQRNLWQIVFAIAAACFFFGNLQYLIFGSTKTQAWNDADFLSRGNKSLTKNNNSDMNLKTLIY